MRVHHGGTSPANTYSLNTLCQACVSVLMRCTEHVRASRTHSRASGAVSAAGVEHGARLLRLLTTACAAQVRDRDEQRGDALPGPRPLRAGQHAPNTPFPTPLADHPSYHPLRPSLRGMRERRRSSSNMHPCTCIHVHPLTCMARAWHVYAQVAAARVPDGARAPRRLCRHRRPLHVLSLIHI